MDLPPSYEELISADRQASSAQHRYRASSALPNTPSVRLTSRPTSDDRPRSTTQSSVPEYAQPPRYVRPPPVVVHPTAPPLPNTDAGECGSPPDDSREQLVNEIRHSAVNVRGKYITLEEHITSMESLGTSLQSKKEELLWKTKEWRDHLLEVIHQEHEKQVESIILASETEKRKLERNLVTARRTRDASKHLLAMVPTLTTEYQRQDLGTIKGRLELLVGELSSAIGFPHGGEVEWSYTRPMMSSAQEHAKELMGEVELPELRVEPEPEPTAPPPEPEESGTEHADQPQTEVSEADTLPTEEESAPASETVRSEPSRLFSEPYMLLYSFSTKTFKDKARCHPMHFDVTPSGYVVVPDKFNSKVKIFTLRGQLIREIVSARMHSPTCVAVSQESGLMYVSDADAHAVHVFSEDGALLSQYLRVLQPHGIALTRDDQLVVADTGARMVAVFGTNHSDPLFSIRQYVWHGRNYAYFEKPQYVSVDCHDKIAVSDHGLHNIPLFDSTGSFLKTLTKNKIRIASGANLLDGQFNEPYGLAHTADQCLVVADYGNHRIQHLDTILDRWTTLIFPDMGIKFPTHVKALADGRLILTEYLTGLVKVFGTTDHEVQVEEMQPPAYEETFAAIPVSSSSSSNPPLPGYYDSSSGGWAPQVSGDQSYYTTSNMTSATGLTSASSRLPDGYSHSWNEWNL